MNPKLKILHITPIYPTEENPGRGTFVKSQIDSLEEYVDNTLLVLPGSNGILPYIKSVSKVKEALANDYDIIHIHFGHVSTMVKLIYKGLTPIVTSYFGSDLYGNVSASVIQNIKGSIIKRLNREYASRDTHSIVKTDKLGQLITGISKNITTIPNGVDLEVFKNRDQVECRIKMNLPLEKKMVLFPTNPENKVKNFGLLKAALLSIDSSKYELVTFEGGNIPHADVPYYLSAADLIVCTSIHEGSPNVIKEAMACNCTIYSTDCGDVRSLLDGVSDGKILNYDSREWAQAINGFLSDPNLETASNAREILKQKKLDKRSIALRILEVYKAVI